MKIFIRSQVIKEFGIDFADYEETLQIFRENPSHSSLNLEKLHSKGAQPLYSIRDNRERRIILCPIKTKLGEQVWVVTKIFTRHEYEKLKNGGGIVSLSDAEKEELTQAYVEVGSGKEEKSELEIKETTQVEYVNQQYIFLDDEQESLKKASLPRIISGAPGSGKTSTLLALIKHNMAHWAAQKEEGQLPRILVLAKSKFLVEQMQKEWQEMCKKDRSIKPEWIKCIEFQTPEDIYKANHPGQAITFIGETEFIKWYLEDYAKKHNNKHGKQAALPMGKDNAALIYQELHTMSGYSNLDTYNNQVNDNLSLFADPKARKTIWQVYEAYRSHLNKQDKKVDLAFKPVVLSRQYDFVGVDEAQDLSRQQLRTLVQIDRNTARKNLVVCVGDHQRLFGSESTIPFLKTLFWEVGEKEAIQNSALHASYRCAEPIIRFANESLILKYQAIGGSAVADSNELPFIEGIGEQKKGNVVWLGGSDSKSKESDSEKLAIISKNNRENADFVVITSPEHFEDAVSKFGRERVFTAKQMKGLQAKEVLLYKFFEQDGFKAANKPISREPEIDLQKALEEGKIPKGCKDGNICHNNIFNELFVAITRAQASLIIYQPEQHDIAAITARLKKSINGNSSAYAPSQEVHVSSEEDWRKRVEELKARAKSDPDPKLQAMILEIEKNYLKNSSEMKQEVTESKAELTPLEAYLSRVNPEADAKTAIQNSTSKGTNKGKKQQLQKQATQSNVRSQPSKPPVKKETKEESLQDMDVTLASLSPEKRLDVILEYIIQGKVEAIDALLNFPFQELKDYQSLSKEEQIAQNLPAQVLIKYVNPNKVERPSLPEPLIRALAAYTKQISSLTRLEQKERQDAFMAFLNYRSVEWPLPLAVLILKAPNIDKTTIDFMQGFKQKRRNELNSGLMSGEINVVPKLQRLGLINTEDGEGKKGHEGGTPLQCAAYNGHVELISKLLAAGADIHYTNKKYGTALHLAVRGNHPEAIAALIKNGADINQPNEQGETPLHLALQIGNIEAAIALIKNGANVDKSSNNIESPLHVAVRKGYIEVINALLERNVNVNQTNADCETPLHVAVKNNKLLAIKALLKKGAELNKYDFFYQTPLYIAVEKGYTEAISVLIEDKGADVNKACTDYRESPLYVAVYRGDEQTVAALIKAGADVNQANSEGQTPLIAAAVTGNVNIVSALIAVEGCRFDTYKASIEEIEENVQEYGDKEAKERAKKFIETRKADEDGNFSILPHEMAAILGHDKVKVLIQDKMDQSVARKAGKLGVFGPQQENSFAPDENQVLTP
ncbi:ankyrin repeat domain-containing protein [Legionella sp. CNM-1927-20]|uniref:ankyrin repeat domain-containing protein n=1 Tax=Legionella sp. CNM-1927-20 TaxID=3422221 RepID=UPI00403A86A7